VPAFVPSLELARAFYHDVLAKRIGQIPHAAALIGEGSEVLGFDTARSTDHAWGPRGQIFVTAAVVEQVRELIDAQLPDTFRGWPVHYYRWQTKRVEHHIEVTTLHAWLEKHFGASLRTPLTTSAWLATPQQLLLEVTRGAVFHDDSGELTHVRELLRWYPEAIWLWMMAAQWGRLAGEESFMGRTAELGDDLGTHLVATTIARHAIQLCFLQGRQYMPYAKWVGPAFARLPAASAVGEVLKDLYAAEDYGTRGEAVVQLYGCLARQHNTLGVTPTVSATIDTYQVGINDAVRPYPVLNASRFKQACLQAITDEALRRLPVVGAIDQLVEPTDLLIHFTDWPQRFRTAYQDQIEALLGTAAE